MNWTSKHQKTLNEFVKYFTDSPEGYTCEAIGEFSAHFHEAIRNRNLEDND